MAKRNSTSGKRSALGRRLESRMLDLRDTLQSNVPLEKKFTARVVTLDLEPRDFDGDEIREIRQHLQVSQAIFAQILGASVKTIASWEQGTRTPTFMARRLLEFIKLDAGRLRELLARSVADAEISCDENEHCEDSKSGELIPG